MPTPFFSRRSRLFGLPNSLVIMMALFFALPFALRGARDALENMENKVTDWLPSEFPETKRLDWFREHFVGEQFVLLTWEGCHEGADAFQLFVKRLRAEISDGHPFEDDLQTSSAEQILSRLDQDENGSLNASEAEPRMGPRFAECDQDNDDTITLVELETYKEQLRARRLGDELGLHFANDYSQNWGGLSERWLQGNGGLWYYITPDGSLYRWVGRPNVVSGLRTFFKRNVLGRTQVSGEIIAQFSDQGRRPKPWNRYYNDPNLLTARYFHSVRTGPDIVAELTSPGGPLRPRTNISEKEKARRARNLAMQRLTGALFAPAVPQGFTWTATEFEDHLPPQTREKLPDEWKTLFEAYVKKIAKRYFEGDIAKLSEQTMQTQSRLWDEFFGELRMPPPPRQTCIMVTLSDAGKRDLRNVLGRGLLGQAPGKIIYLAEHSGIDPPPKPPISPFQPEPPLTGPVIRMGGPPVDNVAIDEEGQITLVRLVGFSGGVGLLLSMLCFRSIKVTMMLFFVGGCSAIASLAIVCYVGGTVDAILMTMPSLVYVLGLSASIHIVNYYRDAVDDGGVDGAPERAVKHGWWPCTIAAFTTSLGLLSLCRSNIVPISKFGFYSALGVMATLVILFAYLPSAMQMAPPRFRRSRTNTAEDTLLTRFWLAIGGFVVRRYALVSSVCVIALITLGMGLQKIQTSVELLKLFDPDSKIIQDYDWLERNFGKLVPMELVVQLPSEMQAEVSRNERNASDNADAGPHSLAAAMTFLDRLELASLIQSTVEDEFGESGRDIMGPGLSAATFAPTVPSPTYQYRQTINQKLLKDRQLLPTDYYALDKKTGDELWRISLRLGALNNVDYGDLVYDLRQAVNPVVAAYHYRIQVLAALEKARGKVNPKGSKVVVLGANPFLNPPPEFDAEAAAKRQRNANQPTWAPVDQTKIFAEIFQRIMLVRGFRTASNAITPLVFHDPTRRPIDDWKEQVESADCVIVVNEQDLDLAWVRNHAKNVILATDWNTDPVSQVDESGRPSTSEGNIQVTYTGVVPIVYKAQRTLLTSLMDSIGWAFVMIAIVMMLLLRYARSSLFGAVNVGGGLTSMIPNVFPVVIIFGAMGHLGFFVDIGSMMTASVAMGVAVDDTIHFLTWYRNALESGQDRKSAIMSSYRRVSAAMTQTTLIGGLGLSVFAFSTFTPTQKFGILMLTLLVAALIGDLILLPALLASPLGKLFEPRKPKPVADEAVTVPSTDRVEAESAQDGGNISGPHRPAARRRDPSGATRRTDPGH